MTTSDPDRGYLAAPEEFRRPHLLDSDDEALLKHLLELRHDTDPIRGEESAREKEDKATLAMVGAGQLFWRLAGWALEHHIGRHTGRKAFQNGMTEHGFEYRRAGYDLALFGHIFEYLGHELYKYGEDKEVDRAIIKMILYVVLGGTNDQLRKAWSDTSAALDALRYGEVHDVLKPGRRSLYGLRYTLFNHRRIAVCYANFLHGQGVPKRRAVEMVAAAYGVDYETVRTWERKNLPEMFESIVYWKALAKGAGEWERRRQVGEVAEDAIPKNVPVHSLHVMLTRKTLEEHGREYKRCTKTCEARSSHGRRHGVREHPPIVTIEGSLRRLSVGNGEQATDKFPMIQSEKPWRVGHVQTA